MPPIETAFRCQQAQCWAATGFDDQGERTVAAPVTLAVRWVAGQAEAIDPLGNTVNLDATVVVDRDIPIGSILQLVGGDGALHEAVASRTTPDLKARNVRRTVGLRRFRDTLPTVAAPLSGGPARG
jgi:hypothetical protein